MGANQTSLHVANAFHLPIWVKIDRTKTAQHNPGTTTWDMNSVKGFTKIDSESSVLFYPEKTATERVYITILTDGGSVVCNSHPYVTGLNVIVNRNGCLLSAKPGEVWVDTDDVDYKR